MAEESPRAARFRERFFQGVPRFSYVGTLGRGGMGLVYEAEDRELGERIAIKVLVPGNGPHAEDLLTRFKREVTLARRIKHPNVAQLHEFGVSGGIAYITMELVAGRTLLAWVRALGRLTPPSAVSVLRQVALGADAAHRLGIVHRDLKSANVMMNDEGHASILDFGLARGAVSGDLTGRHLVGTPEYMAPEQVLGYAVDARSDVYSIGVIAFEILTGSLPYSGENAVAVALRHVHDPLPDSLERIAMPDGLRALVRRALSKDPAGRPQGAGELAQALAEVARGAAVLAPAGVPGEVPASGPARAPSTRPAARSAVRRRRDAEAGEAAIAAAPKTVVRRHRPVVVAVEGDSGRREQIAGALSASGCEVESFADAATALGRIPALRPDLVVAAVALAGLDGFDAARILKASPATASIPVLLVAERITKERAAFAQQVGAAEIVARPQALGALAWKAWRHLRRAGFPTPEELESARRRGRETLERKE